MAPLVPVQEILDSAISFMRAVPPRDLLPLARRYRKGVLAQLTDDSSRISLFQPPQSWALAPSVPADWLLKKRARGEAGAKSTSAQNPTLYAKVLLNVRRPENDGVDVEFHSEKMSRNNKDALIASGMGGPGDNRDKMLQILLLGGIAVALLSVTWAYVARGEDLNPLKALADAASSTPSTIKDCLLPARPKFNLGNAIRQIFDNIKNALSDDAVMILE